MGTLLQEKEFITKYSDYDINHVNNFSKFCETTHRTLPKETIETLGKILFNKSTELRMNVPVVCLRMGLGKSTSIHLYNEYMLETFNSYRSVIAVERVADIKRLCDDNPKYFGLYGFKTDECKKKFTFYNPNNCRWCDYKDCRIKQNDVEARMARVIVTTHARLLIALKSKNVMDQLLYFYDSEDSRVKFRRDELFIDESPSFYTIEKVTKNDILKFQNALHTTFKIDCAQRRSLISYFEKYISQRKKELANVELYHIKPLTTEEVIEFDQMTDLFLKNYYGGYYNICLNTLTALKFGGIRKHDHMITPTFTQLSVGDFKKAFIFDGTAAIDRTYPQNMLIINMEDRREFINSTLHANRDHNLSKTYYDDHIRFIPEIVEEILSKLNYHNKILIVTFKEQEDLYRNYFDEQQLTDRIYLDHFNNLKGKNEYRDATCVFVLGSIYKGDEYYGLFVNEDLNNIEFININKQRIAVYKDSQLPCKSINDFIICDNIVILSQIFFRISPRDDPYSTAEFFFFSTNDEVIEGVHDYFNGSTLDKNWFNKKSNYVDFVESIYKEFENKDNHFILKKDFCIKYNINPRSFRRYLNNNNTYEILFSLNITTDKLKIKKEIHADNAL